MIDTATAKINSPKRIQDLRDYFRKEQLQRELRNAIEHDASTKNMIAYFGMLCNELSQKPVYNPSSRD